MSRRRIRPATAPLLVALAAGPAACGGGYSVTVPRLVVETESVTFDSVAAFQRHRAPLVFTNAGTERVRVLLEPEDDSLIVTADAITLGPRASGQVEVIVVPSAYESFEGSVRVRAGDVRTSIPVSVTVSKDADSDGYEAVAAGGDDCDDTRADVNPGMDERCDGRDTDCSGLIDDGAFDTIAVWPDADADTWGALTAPEQRCVAGAGWADRTGDCDDADPEAFPDRIEEINRKDDDCDGLIDEQLLMRGALLINEIFLAPDGGVVPQYVEIKVRGSGLVHLQGVQVFAGTDMVTLDGGAVRDGDVVLLCGVVNAGRVDGRRCLGPLPGVLADDDDLRLVGPVEIDSVDWSGWTLPDAGALELDPGVVTPFGNDAPDAWCEADGSPWRPNAPCEEDG